MEWSDRNKFNSFNSYKGLTYYKNYKEIMKWMDGESYLPPPVECNLDPYAACNLNCYFCVVQRYIKHHREEIGMSELPADYSHRLIDFLSDWGVRGLCISGGGEPTLHRELPNLINHASEKMDVSLVTNITVMNTELIKSMMYCKWIALSVDAGDRYMYRLIKGKDMFKTVVENIGMLTRERERAKSHVSLCFKFLVLPENQHFIYEACKLAKELGVQDFHARPVDFEREDIEGNKKLDIDIKIVKEQFEKCHEIEDGNFHVYTVTHKFDPEFHVKHDFTRCLATPLVLPILTDGNAYLCVDRKMESKFKLGSCYPDPESILEWWGSDAHRDLIKSVNINECSRCTWSEYNRQISDTVIEDRMDLAFP